MILTSPEVMGLSQFRDDVLNASALGRLLVHIYYCVSPESMKFAVRKLLDPIVRIVGKRLETKTVSLPKTTSQQELNPE